MTSLFTPTPNFVHQVKTKDTPIVYCTFMLKAQLSDNLWASPADISTLLFLLDRC